MVVLMYQTSPQGLVVHQQRFSDPAKAVSTAHKQCKTGSGSWGPDITLSVDSDSSHVTQEFLCAAPDLDQIHSGC